MQNIQIFFPDAISSLNEFITHFDHLPTPDGLKKHLLSFFALNPSLFLVYMTLMVFEIFFN